jgi:hypothetical protein
MKGKVSPVPGSVRIVGGAILRMMSETLTMASMMLGGYGNLSNKHDGWKVDVDVCGMMSA